MTAVSLWKDEAEISDSKFQECPEMLVELQRRCKNTYENCIYEMSTWQRSTREGV